MSSRSEAAVPLSRVVRLAVAGLPPGAWLLAVSGGRDSMVLLDAFATAGRRDVRAVATFDHGSGPASRRATALVERVAAEHGYRFVTARMAPPAAPPVSEAAWRAARWRFLLGWARELEATVVTAHTRDDQLETVALRVLRHAGARGLAGMSHGPGIARPLLGVRREDVLFYANDRAVEFVEDPSNASRLHARNRVRLDLLPALERARPGFGEWLLTLAARAAAWRAGVEALVEELERTAVVTTQPDGSVVVRAAPLATLGAEEWRVLWPALVARAGLAMDRRGVARASAWAAGPAAVDGARGMIPLAGGGEIERTRNTFVVRRASRSQGTP